MRRTWSFYQHESGLPDYSPRGNFSSTLPDIFEGQRFATTAFNDNPTDKMPGIDLRLEAQQRLLLRMVELYPEFGWSEHSIPGRRFHFAQAWYKQADSICLYSMLRLFRPRKVVEIGSGFSSALMLDVNTMFFGRSNTHLNGSLEDEVGMRLTYCVPFSLSTTVSRLPSGCHSQRCVGAT
jgi:hypothetical protein